MMMKHTGALAAVVFFAVFSLGATRALAHCDGLDGPVVTAAQNALESGDLRRVLIWVGEEDEAEVRAAFDETVTVRKLGADARALADRYFFETVVRIHRAGEGAPFTGLKPAGRDLGPAIPAADAAIATGSPAALAQLLTEKVRQGLHAHFASVMEKKDFSFDDVAAGRTYVDAYVTYVHYVERLYEDAAQTAKGHFPSH